MTAAVVVVLEALAAVAVLVFAGWLLERRARRRERRNMRRLRTYLARSRWAGDPFARVPVLPEDM